MLTNPSYDTLILTLSLIQTQTHDPDPGHMLLKQILPMTQILKLICLRLCGFFDVPLHSIVSFDTQMPKSYPSTCIRLSYSYA